jgi:serine/threonine protein kinase
MPRHIEHDLRQQQSLKDIFTPINADRQVLGRSSDGTMVSRTLIVTDFCTSGSVLDYSNAVRNNNNATELFQKTNHIMGQMIQVFMDIQKANCCFTDSKLTNWLVDEQGNIRIADTKSFIYTENGQYKPNITGNEKATIVCTYGFQPRELYKTSFDAEKLHAAILGRNIYACLTGKWPTDPISICLSRYELVFQDDMGQKYLTLINDLTKDPPYKRMNLADAKIALENLETRLTPEFIIITNKAKALDNIYSLKLPSFIDKIINEEQAKAGYSREKTLKNIEDSLDKLQSSFDECNNLINEIDKVTLDNKPFITLNKSHFKTQLHYKINNPHSINEIQQRTDIKEEKETVPSPFTTMKHR